MRYIGGRGGIRTHERLAPLPVFKTGAFDHSATLPNFYPPVLVPDIRPTRILRGETGRN